MSYETREQHHKTLTQPWNEDAHIPTTAEQERLQIARALQECNPTKPWVVLHWKIRDEHALHLRTRGFIVETKDANYRKVGGLLNTVYNQEETIIRLVPDRLAALIHAEEEEGST